MVWLLFSWRALAVEVSFDGDYGKSYVSQTLGVGDQYHIEDSHLHISDWQVSLTGNRSQVESDTGEVEVTRGRDISLGGGMTYLTDWHTALTAYQSSTPETQFIQRGGELSFSYAQMDSHWPFSLGIGFGGSQIEQDIAFTILNRTFQRRAELEQRLARLSGTISPADWLLVKWQGQAFRYSRSKADLQAAFQSRFLNYYTADLISSISGLPEYSGSLELIFSIGDSWDISFFGQRTHLIVDDSELFRSEIMGTRYFSSWNLGLGLSRLRTSHSSETLFLVRVAFR